LEIVITEIDRKIITVTIFIMVITVNVPIIVVITIVVIDDAIVEYIVYAISYELDVKEWRCQLLKPIKCVLIDIRKLKSWKFIREFI
jgi:hypothetical protein